MRLFKEDIETKELEQRQYAYKELSGDIVWNVDSRDVVMDAIVYGDDKGFEEQLESLKADKGYDEVERPDYHDLRPILSYLNQYLPIYRVAHNRPQFTGRFIDTDTKKIVETVDSADIPVECSYYDKKYDDYNEDTEYIRIYPDEMDCWDNVSGHDLAMFNRFLKGQEQDEWIPLEDFADGDY